MFNKQTAVKTAQTLTDLLLTRRGATVFATVRPDGVITSNTYFDRTNRLPPVSMQELQNRLGIYEHVDARAPDARSGEAQAFVSNDNQDSASEGERNPAQFWLRSGPLYGLVVIALGFGDIEDDRQPAGGVTAESGG